MPPFPPEGAPVPGGAPHPQGCHTHAGARSGPCASAEIRYLVAAVANCSRLYHPFHPAHFPTVPPSFERGGSSKGGTGGCSIRGNEVQAPPQALDVGAGEPGAPHATAQASVAIHLQRVVLIQAQLQEARSGSWLVH